MNEQELVSNWLENSDVYSLCKYYWNVDITAEQEKIVESIACSQHKRTIINCMTRYGKSYCVSMAILLWIVQNPNKKVALIAPTNEKTGIIRNYINWFITSSVYFSQLVDMEKSGIERIKKEVSRKRITFKNGTELRTLSAEGQGEALMGFGADLVVVDEECYIDFEVYRSKITRMLGDNPDSIYVGIGNPIHRDNQMWQHWIDPTWFKIHINCEQALKEGRISQEFLEEQRQILTDREFQVLYLAEFPETSEDALIDWNWIDRATKVEITHGDKVEIICGVDVAEQGNDLTVVSVGTKDLELNKYKLLYVESWGKTDLMPTVAKILPIIDKYKVQKINIDSTGVGSGVYSRLEELKREGRISCLVNAFKGGLSPDKDTDRERFLNLKAQSYWHLRSLFEANKISIMPHRTLVSQLSKMKWEKTSSEKIRIRDPGTKEGDTAEEKSPDYSDSLNIMCWSGQRVAMMVSNLNMSNAIVDRSWKPVSMRL